MKRMILILLSLLLLCTACTIPAGPAQEPTDAPTEPTAPTETPTEPEAPAAGLFPLISFDAKTNDHISDMAVSGDEAVLLLANYGTSDADSFQQSICFVDLAAGTAGDLIPLEACLDPDAYLVDYTDDGALRLYNPYTETAALYDRDGSLLEIIPNETPAADDPQFANDLANNWFTYQDEYAFYHTYDGNEYLYSAYAFRNEPEALYLIDGGFDYVCCADGRRLLEADYLPEGQGLEYRLIDLAQEMLVDSVTLKLDVPAEEAPYIYLNDVRSVLYDGGALIQVTKTAYEASHYEDGDYGEDSEYEPEWEESVYLWRFTSDNSTPLSVTRVTEQSINAENEAIVARIEARDGIKVMIESVPEFDGVPDERCTTGCEPFSLYELLLQLDTFLQRLPEGFILDLRTDPTEETLDPRPLSILIVKEIEGDTSAYANGWGDEMLICFATDEFTVSHLPHEFMHLMEHRIHAVWEARGEDFWDYWDSLNPQDFYYNPDDYEEDVFDYFVSFYAMTGPMEDRAETFMYVFGAGEPLSECDWYVNSPQVQKKVAVLLDAIRDAYPSVQAAENVYWER